MMGKHTFLVFFSLICLSIAQIPNKRLISFRVNLITVGDCSINNCEGTSQAELDINVPSNETSYNSCIVPYQVMWSQTNPDLISTNLTFHWDETEHNLDGEGAPGSWHNLFPAVYGSSGGCTYTISFSAFVRENEIFPTGQMSSTEATIQLTTNLVYDIDSTGCYIMENCQQTVPVTLSEGEMRNIAGVGCFDLKDVFWESAGGNNIKYWTTLSYESDTVVVSCLGPAGQLCEAEPEFHYTLYDGDEGEKCGFTKTVGFNTEINTPTSSEDSTSYSPTEGSTASGTTSSTTSSTETSSSTTSSITSSTESDNSVAAKSTGTPNHSRQLILQQLVCSHH